MKVRPGLHCNKGKDVLGERTHHPLKFKLVKRKGPRNILFQKMTWKYSKYRRLNSTLSSQVNLEVSPDGYWLKSHEGCKIRWLWIPPSW